MMMCPQSCQVTPHCHHETKPNVSMCPVPSCHRQVEHDHRATSASPSAPECLPDHNHKHNAIFNYSWLFSQYLLTELRFYVHRTQNRSFRTRSSQPISWCTTEKLKQTQQKQTCISNKTCYNKKNTKKQSKVWSPLMTTGLRTKWGYSGRRRLSKEVNK